MCVCATHTRTRARTHARTHAHTHTHTHTLSDSLQNISLDLPRLGIIPLNSLDMTGYYTPDLRSLDMTGHYTPRRRSLDMTGHFTPHLHSDWALYPWYHRPLPALAGCLDGSSLYRPFFSNKARETTTEINRKHNDFQKTSSKSLPGQSQQAHAGAEQD